MIQHHREERDENGLIRVAGAYCFERGFVIYYSTVGRLRGASARMAAEAKRFLFMGLGLFDFVRDKLEEIAEELAERGEERSEDIREFIDDLVETLPFLKKEPEDAPGAEPEEEPEENGLQSLAAEVDAAGMIAGLLERLGLATPEDLKGIKDRLDRLERAIDSLND
jgi:polyhydroxyalkanoate synthesis regulator phasin